MIKGVDNQVMTQRTVEYSKDVSAMMRRDELNNEFADRMSKLNARQEAQTVNKAEKAEHARVKSSREKEPDKGGKGGRGGGQPRQGRRHPPLFDEDGLPSVGSAMGEKLLDIEV